MYVDAFVLIVNRVKQHPDPQLSYNDTETEDVVAHTFRSYPSDAQKDKAMDKESETHKVNYSVIEKRRVKVKAE